MSLSLIELYTLIDKEIYIDLGSIVFICGVIGGILNIIVFLSLQTFRENSGSFYLIIMSFVNVGYLITNLLPILLIQISNIDASSTSLFYCKFQKYFVTICITISMTCFCLSTMDQYCTTSSRRRFQQWCNMKLAKRLVIIFSLFWILHATPYLFLFYHNKSPTTGKTTCTMSNRIYIQYRSYFIVLILFGILPLSISMFFGIMSFLNIQQISHYTLPLVRRELNKQLTKMVLTEVIVNCVVQIPYIIICVIKLNPNFGDDPFVNVQVQLSYDILINIFYFYAAVSTCLIRLIGLFSEIFF